MGTSNDNPYQSPDALRQKASDRIEFAGYGRWQIVVVTVLTYVMSGACLLLASLLTFVAITSSSADGVYINDTYFIGPDELAWLIFGFFIAILCSLVLSGLALFAAIGLQKRRKWGWRLTIALAVLLLVLISLLPTDFTHLLIPWGAYGVLALLILLQQKIRLQFQHVQGYAEESEA